MGYVRLVSHVSLLLDHFFCISTFIFILQYFFRFLTSSPKASNGQWFPCPALLYLVLIGGSRAVAPIEDEFLQNGEKSRLFIHLSIRLSICSPPLGHPARPEAQPAGSEARLHLMVSGSLALLNLCLRCVLYILGEKHGRGLMV